MKVSHRFDSDFQFPVPLDKIANEFHITVEDVQQFLLEMGAEIGHVCGKPAVEPHYFVLAFRKSYSRQPIEKPKARKQTAKPARKPRTTGSSDEARVDEILDSLNLEAIDFDVLDQKQVSASEASRIVGLPDTTFRRMLGKTFWVVPGEQPQKVCTKSLILYLHEKVDPRIEHGGDPQEARK